MCTKVTLQIFCCQVFILRLMSALLLNRVTAILQNLKLSLSFDEFVAF